jgi:hypothetical protein
VLIDSNRNHNHNHNHNRNHNHNKKNIPQTNIDDKKRGSVNANVIAKLDLSDENVFVNPLHKQPENVREECVRHILLETLAHSPSDQPAIRLVSSGLVSFVFLSSSQLNSIQNREISVC